MTLSQRLAGLYAITPDVIDTALLLEKVDAVLAGATLIQYRDKHASPSERRVRAEALLRCCRNAQIPLIVNDDLQLALAIDADGVHLGKDDGDLMAARRALDQSGRPKILGVSCYANLDRAAIAVQSGADYLAFGAAFASPTKPQANIVPAGLFAAARQRFSVPICAIGGITLENAPDLIDLGVDLIATVNDLFFAANIAARAIAYRNLFGCVPDPKDTDS